MGRSAKVPVNDNKLVKTNKIGTGSATPYHPRDVNWAALRRMGFDSIPEFADNKG